MYMTEADICREYRQAKDKQKQISVLADMNACASGEIIALLVRNGEKVEPGAKGREGDAMKGRGWDTEKAMALYNEGKTDQEIAEAVFVHRATVGLWRRTRGLPPNWGREKAAKASAPPASSPPAPERSGVSSDEVKLSVELNGCAFALRAPTLEGAAWAYEYAGRLLDFIKKAAVKDG